MKIITEQDAYFLVALNASEESSLIELKWEFEKWDHGSIDVTNIIESLINDGTILLSERDGDSFSDYSISGALVKAETWSNSESWSTILFLTEAGDRRWEIDDWGITTKRAKHLLFSNKGSVTRVQ
ncbi:hypothetical protein ACJJJB_11530 [Microbulbifer sp. ANSA001]|uniref:hypothetical protein n=1 Tax=Microbulbifer sp. ANSA001 TaxID=3243358 RepID=UPI004041C851